MALKDINKKNLGFTIIELLVVVVIISILSTLVIVSYSNIRTRAYDAVVAYDVNNVDKAEKIYIAQNDIAKAYYSGNGYDEDLNIRPGEISVIDVVVSGADYCVRGYSLKGSKNSIYNATTAESTTGMCDTLEPSSTAIANSPALEGWASISVGYYHSCALKSDGSAYCWGNNEYGQLGNGSTNSSLNPVAVDMIGVLSGKTIKSISIGKYHTCAIASDDRAYCWGYNNFGQLGNNSNTQSANPVAVYSTGALSGLTIKEVSSGWNHNCVIASNDQSYCWGLGENGQLGNFSSSNQKVPVAVKTDGVLSGLTVKSISSGGMHTCVIASNDSGYCWGASSYGQLGKYINGSPSYPVGVDVITGKTLKTISAGGRHTCAITNDDLIYCWGMGTYGQVGNNTNTEKISSPVAVNTGGVLSGKTIKSIATGMNSTCVVASDSQVYCWGWNVNGQLGIDSADFSSLIPVAVNNLSGKTIKAISGNNGGSMCATTSNNNVYCWGDNGYGQLGNGANSNNIKLPGAIDTSGALNGKTIKVLSAGEFYNCVIASDDKAYCWGQNDYGQLGNNSTNNTAHPTPVDTSGLLKNKTIKAISASKGNNKHTCVIASDDNAYCWGQNTYGELGNGRTTYSGATTVPVAVDTTGYLSGKTVKALSVGSFHTCVIASDDQAYCWGWNSSGQLGNNSTTNSSLPVPVDATGELLGLTLKSISAGSNYTCVIASNDKLYCWGDNKYGQLGNNSTTNSLVPVPVNTSDKLLGKTIKAVSTSGNYQFTCAIASDDNAYCWGDGSRHGRLGNNVSAQSKVPVAVSTTDALQGKTVKSITTGEWHACAIASDDNAYCWGQNSYGELGTNTIVDSLVPIAVNTSTGGFNGKTVKSISAGYYHTCAIASDDQVYCWGEYARGQLGYTVGISSPIAGAMMP